MDLRKLRSQGLCGRNEQPKLLCIIQILLCYSNLCFSYLKTMTEKNNKTPDKNMIKDTKRRYYSTRLYSNHNLSIRSEFGEKWSKFFTKLRQLKEKVIT